jgi:hypothetical protein
MLMGQRIEVAATTVVELRSPRNLRMLLRHKHRKADAILREVFRFLPKAREMRSPMRAIFLWRAAFMTVVPLASLTGGLLIATSVMAEAAGWVGEANVWTLGLMAIVLTTRPVRQFLRLAMLAGILVGVSASAFIAYPFSRQTASFPKVVQPSEYRFSGEPE